MRMRSWSLRVWKLGMERILPNVWAALLWMCEMRWILPAHPCRNRNPEPAEVSMEQGHLVISLAGKDFCM